MVRNGNDSVYVYCTVDEYVFLCDDQLIARIKKFTKHEDFVPAIEGYDIEPYYDITVINGANEELKMLIFSFPMLRF